MKSHFVPAIAMSAALLLTACESTNSPAVAPAPAVNAAAPTIKEDLKDAVVLIPVSKVNGLVRGMRTQDVKELLGDPYEKRPFPKGGPGAEIWTYRTAMWERADQVPVAMQNTPAFDPLTNRQVTRQDPVYQIQHVRTYETIELLIMDDRLIERKPGPRQVDRAFY